ncbi:hypothetical protein AAV35_012585 [Salimicrobium jeotgali]|uniref:Uncharacterized protein n=1 Tax=Salimicrobium jeotgali TaxID=1230341 RepID=K2H3Q6_9BACI|nr:IBR domain-containing protein [Salimicrobium jeotgali]AKG05509.1 hypothetical protein AAV35_012585 [Salimicrobium jeotgali]EKE30510.1 hypothetical protein MJ3_13754 [Salimicrobium jeotgali]MBM7696659.1 hypothetical protein [Salimicrobium jeotgali]
MSLGFKARKQIDDYIELLAFSKATRFYPTAVSRHASVTPSEAFNYLLEQKSGPGNEVSLMWELQCPNLDCIKTISLSEEKHAGGEVECPRCGFEFELDSTDFIPVFVINQEYKDYVLAEHQEEHEKKKLKNLTEVLR